MLVILCKNDEIQKISSHSWKGKTEWSGFDENDAIRWKVIGKIKRGWDKLLYG